MKVFISMGMKSKSTEQVKVEMQGFFEKIKSVLPDAELIDSVIDGADKNIAAKGDSVGVWYLGESLKMLSEADIVFFAPGYKDYRGCRLEWLVANEYGKYCVELKN
jgi:hypothetical protein